MGASVRLSERHQLIEALRRDPALQLLVDHQRGAQGAVAKAIHGSRVIAPSALVP